MTSATQNKAMRVRRALDGLCRGCARPAAEDASQCVACQTAARARYALRSAAGCPRCGAACEPGRVNCTRCRARDAARKTFERRAYR